MMGAMFEKMMLQYKAGMRLVDLAQCDGKLPPQRPLRPLTNLM